MTITRPVLFLDIDKTLSPIHDTSAWPDYTSVESAFVGVPVPVSPRLLAAVGELPTDIVYVTDWQQDAHEFDTLLGRDDTTLLERDWSTNGWWKLPAIDGWLIEHPDVTRFIHADDHLAIGSRKQRLKAVAGRHGCVHLAVSPKDGLTPTQIKRMKLFLNAG